VKVEENLAKINVRVPRELHAELLNRVPWGLRRHLVEAVLRLILDAIRQEGPIITGAILAGDFKLVRAAKMEAATAGGDDPTVRFLGSDECQNLSKPSIREV